MHAETVRTDLPFRCLDAEIDNQMRSCRTPVHHLVDAAVAGIGILRQDSKAAHSYQDGKLCPELEVFHYVCSSSTSRVTSRLSQVLLAPDPNPFLIDSQKIYFLC